MTPELYHPVLDCFARGLPHAYRNLDAPAGTVVRLEITGDCGGRWILLRAPTAWTLTNQPAAEPAATVTIPQEFAWRVFTKGISRESARTRIQIDGDTSLAGGILEFTAIVG
jgi:hypothetical protein